MVLVSLSMIIYNGVKGPLMVKGQLWNHNMAAQGSGLGPKELAGLMTYIRNNLGNETGDIVTLEMAKNALAKIDERGEGTQMSQDELKAKWMTKLEGETLDPNTMVDPETWEPVEQ